MTITTPAPRTRARAQPRAPQRPVPSEFPPPPGRGAAPPARGTGPAPRGTGSGTRGTGSTPRGAGPVERVARARSAASQRAYARKAQRLGLQTRARRGLLPAGRAPFVLMIMALLAVGLIASLWLSTAAAGDSYRLEQARIQARELSERSEQLRQEVANLQTAPELARRARDLGMVPTGEPAHLVVQPDGTVLVVGEPVVATVPAPVVPPAPPAPPADQQQPAGGQPPAGSQQPGQGQQPGPGQQPAAGGQPPADQQPPAQDQAPGAGQPAPGGGG